MKETTLLFLLFAPACALAQGDDSVHYKKIKVGIVFSPDFCYRTLRYSGPNELVGNIRNDRELPKFGYTVGAHFRYPLNRVVSLETGFLYADKGEKTRGEQLIWSTPDPSYPSQSMTRYRFQYLDIPFKGNYAFTKGKIGLFLSAGVAMNIFLQKRTVVISEYPDGHHGKDTSIKDIGYSKIGFSVLVGIGINYPVTDRVLVRVEPIFRHSMTSISGEKNSKEYLYSMGLNVAVEYALKTKKR